MRFYGLLSFSVSGILKSPLQNGTSNVWERSIIRLDEAEFDIFSTDGVEDGLNLALIETEGSVSGGDITDTSDSSLIFSLFPDLDGKLNLGSHADLGLGDMNGSPVSGNHAGLCMITGITFKNRPIKTI